MWATSAPLNALLLLPTLSSPLPPLLPLHLPHPTPPGYLRSLQTFELKLHQGALWAHARRSPSLFNAVPAALWARPSFRHLGLSSDVGPGTGGVPRIVSLSFHHLCLKTGSPGQLWGGSRFLPSGSISEGKVPSQTCFRSSGFGHFKNALQGRRAPGSRSSLVT